MQLLPLAYQVAPLTHVHAAAPELELEALGKISLQLLHQPHTQQQLLPHPLQQRSRLLRGQQRLIPSAAVQPGRQPLRSFLPLLLIMPV